MYVCLMYLNARPKDDLNENNMAALTNMRASVLMHYSNGLKIIRVERHRDIDRQNQKQI